jgi:hypothetical protein
LGELNAGKGGILVRAGEAVTDNNGDRLNLVSTRARIEATRGAIGHASRALDLDVPRLEAAAGDSLHLEIDRSDRAGVGGRDHCKPATGRRRREQGCGCHER